MYPIERQSASRRRLLLELLLNTRGLLGNLLLGLLGNLGLMQRLLGLGLLQWL